jgi:DNA-binding CsgD family transcriptional regulator
MIEVDEFTPRQREVIVEMCKGKSNKEIARTLQIAEATVKLHLSEIFRTMGVRNRSSAIIQASDFPVTYPEPVPPLTELDILKQFADCTFETINLKWHEKVIAFGQQIDNRARG